MFDDPKKTLRRMEQELLAAEREETPEPDFGAEFELDEDALLREAKALIGEEEEIPIRNHANGYGTRNYAVDFDRTVYDDEEMDEDKALYAEETKTKGIGGLVVLALLEVLGIVAIVLWWVRWLS